MADDEREAGKSFKVQDRRRFSATGEAREEAADSPAPPPDAGAAAAAEAAPPPGAPSSADAAASYARAGAAPEISFATFVISLSTQALALLGEIPDPVSGDTRADLEGARQFIDILAILQDKTRGNLDPREAQLLEGALYDLRMKYVERSQRR